MNKTSASPSHKLAEHFFRKEYGKMIAVISRYLGRENIATAEDIVQETLLKAVDNWQHHGIPPNPEAWLYTTAKHLTFNILKRKKHHSKFLALQKQSASFEYSFFSNEFIRDEQLKMMFVCCDESISENTQIALILKILCGFGIAEIAEAFFSTRDTINKRLVRGRKQLRLQNIATENPKNLNEKLPVVLKTIYLLYNEGYSPSQKNEVIRYDLCLEAIRLTKVIISSKLIEASADCYALLALMLFNASRFDARMSSTDSIIEMSNQNRKKWNQQLINQGIDYLNKATGTKRISTYLILATISANHCIATSFEKTNWPAILELYNSLLAINAAPIVKLNRSVALSKVEGNSAAILELEKLNASSDIGKNHLFHATLGEFYNLNNNKAQAQKHFKYALSLTVNQRDINILQKKLIALVPNSNAGL